MHQALKAELESQVHQRVFLCMLYQLALGLPDPMLHAFNQAFGIAHAVRGLSQLLLQHRDCRLMIERAQAPDGKVLDGQAKGSKGNRQLLLRGPETALEHIRVIVARAREAMHLAAVLERELGGVQLLQPPGQRGLVVQLQSLLQAQLRKRGACLARRQVVILAATPQRRRRK